MEKKSVKIEELFIVVNY